MIARKFIAPLIVIALVMSAQVYLSRLFDKFPPRIEFGAKNYGLDYADSISVKNLEKLNNYAPSFRKIVPSNIEGRAANVVVTNGNYNRYKEFDVIRGAFFTRNASNIGLNVAVISDKTALALFSTFDCVGNEISIGGLKYKVAAVYRERALPAFLSSDGVEKAYVPSNSDFDKLCAENAAVSSVLLTASKSSPPSLAEKDAFDALFAVSPNTANYLAKDFTSSGKIIGQFAKVEFFALWLITALFVFKFLSRDTLSAIKSKERADTLQIYLKWTISAIILFIAYKYVSFDLYVPARYVSSDRLLDFNFYKSLVTQSIQFRNRYYAYSPSVVELTRDFAVTANALLCAVFAAATVVMTRRAKREILNDRHGVDAGAVSSKKICKRASS